MTLVVGGAFCAWAWYLSPKNHLPWMTDEAAAYAKARAEGKGVMVDFSANWCNPCKELEKNFGYDDTYAAITASFVPLKIDLTDQNDVNGEQETRYRRDTFPHVVFMAADGTELGRIRELVSAGDLLEVIQPAASKLKTTAAVATRTVAWITDETAAYAKAKAENKGVMVEFSATWCQPCKELEKRFVDTVVYDALHANFIPLKVDLTESNDVKEKQESRYKRDTFPHVVFVSHDGNEVGRVRELVDVATLSEVVRVSTRKLREPSPEPRSSCPSVEELLRGRPAVGEVFSAYEIAARLCREDAWSAATIACLRAASTDPQEDACFDQLPAAQRKRLEDALAELAKTHPSR